MTQDTEKWFGAALLTLIAVGTLSYSLWIGVPVTIVLIAIGINYDKHH